MARRLPMRKRNFTGLIAILILTFSTFALSSDKIISYQGKVYSSLGNPVNETSANVRVRFFNAGSGGSQIGTFVEIHQVDIENGLFLLSIGSKTSGGVPSDIFNTGVTVYLSITINNEEQLPRPVIAYVPFTLASYGKEINCADYSGTIDVGYYCIDQNWSTNTVVLPTEAQIACETRNMHVCSWFEYSYACVKHKAGLILLYNILPKDPLLYQHTSQNAYPIFRGFGHKLDYYPDPNCFLDKGAIGAVYYSTSPKIHYRCCITK
jgi:hypothetical protein